jgi:RNA-directed DNA polymerase
MALAGVGLRSGCPMTSSAGGDHDPDGQTSGHRSRRKQQTLHWSATAGAAGSSNRATARDLPHVSPERAGRSARRQAERDDATAAEIGAGRRGNAIASALADSYLALDDWRRPALAAATRSVLGRAPRWIYPVLDEVLAAYPQAPYDRPRELAAYLARSRAFRAEMGGAPGARPEAATRPISIVGHPVAPTRTVRRPFHTTPIDDLASLAAVLGLTLEELDWYADRRGLNHRHSDRRLQHYRHVWLNGRLIEAPKPRLRTLQRRLLTEVIGPIPTHPAAHGFVVGRSPHTFAAPHAGRPLVIRLDVTSFFASVTAARVYGLLRSAGYPEPVAHTITALCTTRTPSRVSGSAPRDVPDRTYRLALLGSAHLPQGAPTSPALANLCGFRLDRRLAGLAASIELQYTRYADDLAFSGDLSLAATRTFVATVTDIASDEGFRINARKTRIRGRGDRQALAGLVVNAAPAVARDEYDALRALLHNASRTGLAEQNHDGHADFRGYLAGRIAWVGHRQPARAAKLAALFDAACAAPDGPD